MAYLKWFFSRQLDFQCMENVVIDSLTSILLFSLPPYHVHQPLSLIRLTFTLRSIGGPSLTEVSQPDPICLVMVIS